VALRPVPEPVDTGHPAVGHERGPAPRATEGGIGIIDLLPSLRSSRRRTLELPRVVEVPIPRAATGTPAAGEEDIPPFPFRRSSPAREVERQPRSAERPALDDASTGSRRPAAGPRAGLAAGAGESVRLTPEAVRLLKATLYELSECRRMLVGVRDKDT
jgi:hypothetical protein